MRLNTEEGASLVEFTLILPLLLLLVFGIIEFGLLMYNKAMLTNASREGARAGIVYHYDDVNDTIDRLSQAEIAQVVNDYCQNYLVTFGSPPTLVTDTNPPNPEIMDHGVYLTVDVSYQYDFFLVPTFVAGLGGGLNLVASTTMRAE